MPILGHDRFAVRIQAMFIALLVAILCLSSSVAEDDLSDLTASEIMNRARNSFQAGEWKEAAMLYSEFLANFGTTLDGQQVLTGVRFDRAIALLQAKEFGEALPALEEALAATPPVTEIQRQELLFWQGVCLMQSQEFAQARAAFEKFLETFPAAMLTNPALRRQQVNAAKIPEAQLLMGSTLLMEGKHREAADFLAGVKPALIPENRGRATVLELYALLQAEAYDEALASVVEEFPRLDNLTQLAAFQTLTLQLGAQFLESQQYRKAIQCLQRIWTSERIIRHQERRLSDLEARIELIEANPRSDAYEKFLLGQMIAKIRRELENFTTIENFDSALRLRLATAFQSMQRYREAALILDDMLERMPADDLVEAASVNLVQCWNAIERWPNVVASSEAFQKKFPKSARFPLILYMEGIARQQDGDLDGAIEVFDRIVKQTPDSDFAPRALFMKGFTQLLADRNVDAIAVFEEFPRRYPRHEMAEAALYWRGMAYSLNKQHETCRDVLAEYLQAYPNGVYAGAAKFRRGYAAHNLMDFETSLGELGQFLREHPGHENESEALVLLGDAYMHNGEMDYGIAAFKRINPADTKFFEEGWFKIGRALKLLEDNDGLRRHMEQFVAEHPRSPRVAEALYQIGWVLRQEGQPEKAVEIYWDAITEYGNDPGIRSVEDLFPALARAYKGPEEQARYLARLRDLREEADEKNQPVLAMRVLWAQGSALGRTDPDRARESFVGAAAKADIPETNPLLLADFAEALLEAGDQEGGEEMFREMLRWHPRAPQKDRAFAALGLLEKERGNERAALRYFERFENETLGSALYGRVLLAKAALEEERGRFEDARTTLEKILANEFSGGREKAEALLRIGDIYRKEGKPQLAVPYYQRIYIMYGRWRDTVARAYLNSGLAFEEILDADAARKTYLELVNREDLASHPEVSEAKARLEKLGGGPQES
jgi:tetratricopeptide (TPR) repeat protein